MRVEDLMELLTTKLDRIIDDHAIRVCYDKMYEPRDWDEQEETINP